MTRWTRPMAAAFAAWLAIAVLPVSTAADGGLAVEGVTPELSRNPSMEG